MGLLQSGSIALGFDLRKKRGLAVGVVLPHGQCLQLVVQCHELLFALGGSDPCPKGFFVDGSALLKKLVQLLGEQGGKGIVSCHSDDRSFRSPLLTGGC